MFRPESADVVAPKVEVPRPAMAVERAVCEGNTIRRNCQRHAGWPARSPPKRKRERQVTQLRGYLELGGVAPADQLDDGRDQDDHRRGTLHAKQGGDGQGRLGAPRRRAQHERAEATSEVNEMNAPVESASRRGAPERGAG